MMDQAQISLKETWKLPDGYSRRQLLERYRKLCLIFHPDKGGDEGKFKKLADEFVFLEASILNKAIDKCRKDCWCCEPAEITI